MVRLIDKVLYVRGSQGFSKEVPIEGTITNWTWDFGDGNSETNLYGFTEHIYESSGLYEASLTVTNIYGQSGQPHVEYIELGSCSAGDINNDGAYNILDIVALSNSLLLYPASWNSQLNV